MGDKIEQLRKLRLFTLKQINGLNSEQLNFIPAGYNNNIIWNLGHLVATIQALCYKRAGLAIKVDDKYFSPFLPATRPEGLISVDEIEVIKELMLTSIATLQTDINNRIFGSYTKSERIEEVYGIEVMSIDDAIDFLLYHEGFHSGYILALKRLV